MHLPSLALLFGCLGLLSVAAFAAAPVERFDMSQWSGAERTGWKLSDGRQSGHSGEAKITGETLRLSDSKPGRPAGVQVVYAQTLTTTDRFNIVLHARLFKLGQEDDGTGEFSQLRLTVGVKTPRGDFGVAFLILPWLGWL